MENSTAPLPPPPPDNANCDQTQWRQWFRMLHSGIRNGTQTSGHSIAMSASPFSYTASTKGTVIVTGGGAGVSSVGLQHAGVVYQISTVAGVPIPVVKGDTVTVASSILGSIAFIPN